MSKTLFARKAIALASQLGEIEREVKDLVNVYVDRGYGSTDPLTDTDINKTPEGETPLTTPITVAQFGEIATVLTELIAFCENGTMAANNRNAVLNKYTRTDV
jgi:hypothetical protein